MCAGSLRKHRTQLREDRLISRAPRLSGTSSRAAGDTRTDACRCARRCAVRRAHAAACAAGRRACVAGSGRALSAAGARIDLAVVRRAGPARTPHLPPLRCQRRRGAPSHPTCGAPRSKHLDPRSTDAALRSRARRNTSRSGDCPRPVSRRPPRSRRGRTRHRRAFPHHTWGSVHPCSPSSR